MGEISRVAILGINYPPETTGIAPYTGAAARALLEHGISSRVLTAHPHYPEWRVHDGHGGWKRRDNVDGVPVLRVQHYVPQNPTGVRRLLSELTFGTRLAFSRLGRPHALLLISPALFSTAIALTAARVRAPRTPAVVWVQDLYSLGVEETGAGGSTIARLMARIESATLRGADHVIVIHDRFAKVVTERLGVPTDRVTVVRNWTHLRPQEIDSTSTTRAKHGWSSDETVVLHSGNMGAKQGLSNVIAAARLADDQRQPVRFVLLGGGSQRESLVEEARGVERIQFIDSLNDREFQSALVAADVLLVNEKPGVSEMAVPSKLTSYFNAGRPVIAATDISGITADEVRAADAGVVVSSGRPQALVDAVLSLRADPVAASAMGERGRRYRERVLDERAAVGALAQVLRSTRRTRRSQ